MSDHGADIIIKGANEYKKELSSTAEGNITRIKNALASFEDHVETYTEKVNAEKKNLEVNMKQFAEPFQYEVNLRLGKKSKLTDDRMIDSICTSDERLEDLLMEIGRRLKEERIKKGYSVSELSQLSGVAATIIYRIESSINTVGLRSLLRLMWSLNVSPAQLIPFDEYAHSKTFGDVIEEMTSNLSPKQKQYLLKVIITDIGFCLLYTSPSPRDCS